MSLASFLRTIASALTPDAFAGVNIQALAKLDPNKIYLENVRSVLGVSSKRALAICEAAVSQGAFQKGVEVRCPDGTVAASAGSTGELPRIVTCWTDTGDGFEPVELETESLEKATFYRLRPYAARSRPHSTAG